LFNIGQFIIHILPENYCQEPGTSLLVAGRTIFVSFMLRDFLVFCCQKKINGYLTILDPAFLSSGGTSTVANVAVCGQVGDRHYNTSVQSKDYS
jgi:hypothetical protein